MHAEILDIILEEVKKINVILTGNGDSSKGLVVRLDRVEGKLRRAGKWLAAVVGIALSVIATVLGAYAIQFIS